MKAIVKDNSSNNFFGNIKDFFSSILNNDSTDKDDLEIYKDSDPEVVSELVKSSKNLEREALNYRLSIGLPSKEKKTSSKKIEQKPYSIKPIAPISKTTNISERNINFSERDI